MTKRPDPPFNRMSVAIEQITTERADIFINGTNLAANVLAGSVSVRLLPETKRMAVTLTLVADDFEHKGTPFSLWSATPVKCGHCAEVTA